MQWRRERDSHYEPRKSMALNGLSFALYTITASVGLYRISTKVNAARVKPAKLDAHNTNIDSLSRNEYS